MLFSVAVPNRDDFKSEAVEALIKLITSVNGNWQYIPIDGNCFVDEARNEAFVQAKISGSDYLLFVDTDISLKTNENVIEKMVALSEGEHVVTGVYYQKAQPFRPVVYHFSENGLITNLYDIPTEPFKVDASGGGLLLIPRSAMEKFTYKFTRTYGDPFDFWNYHDKKKRLREDAAFCYRCKLLGIDIIADPTISLGHVGKQEVTRNYFARMKQIQEAQPLDSVEGGEIQGWMTNEELAWLSDQAKGMENVVEIGSWKGRSTKVLLESCQGRVHAIDHWKGSDTIKELAGQQDIFSQFRQNVGHYPNLVIHKMPSLEAIQMMNGNMFDMVFIDGSHAYEDVYQDIEAWLPRTRKIICGHDYQRGFPGVMQAVQEKFTNFKVVDTIWYAEVGNG